MSCQTDPCACLRDQIKVLESRDVELSIAINNNAAARPIITYLIPDFDVTVADNIASVLLSTEKNFLATEVMMHIKERDAWSATGVFNVGYANASDLAGTIAPWDDEQLFNTAVNETSTFVLGDIAYGGTKASTGFDSIAVQLGNPGATATALVVDVYITGYEIDIPV